MKTNNRQLLDLIRKGFSKEEACAALGLDTEAAEMALMSSTEEKFSVKNVRESLLPLVFDTLKMVIETAERDADKIKACQIILQGEGEMPELNAEDMSDRVRKFKMRMGEVEVIDVVDESRMLKVAS